MIKFSKALTENIQNTYTYAYVKNAKGYTNSARDYDPLDYFEYLLTKENPFMVFMELEHYAFQNSKNALIRYNIPYTESQERAARVFVDVTNLMQKNRSDVVALHVDDLTGTGIVLYKEPYYLATKDTLYVNDQIRRLPRNKQTYNVPNFQGLTLSREQQGALETCLSNQVSCLIGGAGTGKSFVTAELIRQLEKNGKKVAVLTPTHKAREALQSKLKDVKAKAQTIHSFVYGQATDCDAIVIDESGMLSTPLFAKLLQTYDDQQLVFVGDKNQLEPIEYGRPFEQIQQIFKTAELTENRRSDAADIIALGREILGVPQNANMAMPNIEVVPDAETAFKHGAEVVLSFTNANVKSINEQQRIKNGQWTVSPNFSVGDVIVAKTNEKNRFYNGQIFKIISPFTAQKKDSGQIVTFKDQKDLEGNFDLAYGLTIHKSQGSEWDVVAYQPSDMDYQNLAYVAVTRAQKRLIIVGDGIKTEYKPNREWRHIG